MAGYIALHRRIEQHWVFENPDYFRIWVSMLFSANFVDRDVMFNGTLISIKRGQLIFGLNAWSAKYKVTSRMLRTFLSRLESCRMIDKQITNKYSIISITNYDSYQTTDKQTTSKRQASDKPVTVQVTTKEEVKNVNKVNKEKGVVRFTPPTANDVDEYCKERDNGISGQAFVDYYAANGWMRGKNKIKCWKSCVRTWENRDRDNNNSSQSARRLKEL
jgi:hypothetical protein